MAFTPPERRGGAPRARAAGRPDSAPARGRPRRADESPPVGPPRGGIRGRDRRGHGHADVCRRPTSWRPAAALRSGAADVVLGPSEDGGYYLIGLGAPAPELFVNMPWSTATVYAETLARARADRAPDLDPASLVRRRPHRGPRAAGPTRRSGAPIGPGAPSPSWRAWRSDAARPPRGAAGYGVSGEAGGSAGPSRGGLRLLLDPVPGHGDDGPRRVELDRDLTRPGVPAHHHAGGPRRDPGRVRARDGDPELHAHPDVDARRRAPARHGRRHVAVARAGTRTAAGNPGAPSPAR